MASDADGAEIIAMLERLAVAVTEVGMVSSSEVVAIVVALVLVTG